MAKFAITFYDKDNKKLSIQQIDSLNLISMLMSAIETEFDLEDAMFSDFEKLEQLEDKLETSDIHEFLDSYSIDMEYIQIY